MPISPVYSTRFIGVQGLVHDAVYLVPAGFVAVVHHADVYYGPSIPPSEMFLKNFTVGYTIGHWSAGGGSPSYSANWDGTSVIPSGEEFGFSGDGLSAWDVSCSGFLLTEVP